MAGSSEADLKGNNKRAWPWYLLWHAVVHSDEQSSHPCAGLCEEGTITKDKESTVGSRGEAENYDRSLGIVSLLINFSTT